MNEMITCIDCMYSIITVNRYGGDKVDCSIYNCVVDCDSADDCMFFEPMLLNTEDSTETD